MLRSIFFFCTLFLAEINIAQTTLPYLQSPTPNSIWVTWKTDTNPTTISVEYGTDAANLTMTATVSTTSITGTYYWHTAQIKGLNPNTAYFYRTETNGVYSNTYRFKTLPAHNTNTGHLRFLVLGDHQRHNDPVNNRRYERLVNKAREKVESIYGAPLEDHINMVLNVGDQVNTGGSLDEYEHLHLDQSAGICTNIPFMTVVGNHEYHGDSDLSNYFTHFVYDTPDLHYAGIAGLEGENYYAFQVANAVFIMINSSISSQAQTDFVTQIVNTANNDSNIDWIFTDCHHPLYAEVLPGDASPYMLNTILPIVQASPKMTMYMSGHSHIYARGAIKESPIFHSVNGGASWDEYFGQYSGYADSEHIQKTIERQIFQLVDIDLASREMTVETYSIGTCLGDGFNEDVLLDTYYIKRDAPQPNQPTLQTIPASLNLPYTFQGSTYAGQEPSNSTWFQIAEDATFNNPVVDIRQDFENLFESTGYPNYFPIDQNDGLNIFEWPITQNQLISGTNYARVRYRDKSMHWSDWSTPVEFEVLNGVNPQDPIAWFTFENNMNDVSNNGKDFSGGTNDGLTYATTPTIGTHVVGNNNSSLTIQDNDLIADGLPTGAMTAACWVSVDTADTWGGFVGALQDNGSYERGWNLGTRNQKFSFAMVSEGAGFMTYLEDDVDFNLEEWYHVAATYDQTTMRLYVNGQLKTSTTAQNGRILYPPTGWFTLASYKDDNEDWRHDGGLDEVAIWLRALTANEINDIYQNGIVLPAEWLDFTARLVEDEVAIIWQTTQEKNTDYFEVQRSYNRQTWETIHTQKAAGQTSIPTSYEAFDKLPLLGKSYYRIKLYDLDGETDYSLLQSIDYEPVTLSSVKLFPNPTSDELHIKWRGHHHWNISIYSLTGQAVFPNISKRNRKAIVDVKALPKGIYWVLLEEGNQQWKEQFVVQ